MNTFTPCLWFDGKAEEAANFYTSIFKNSAIIGITHYGKAGAEASGQAEGTVMTVSFQLDGQDFLALNGGPDFTFSPAISLIVNCETQEEIDLLWARLSEGGGEPGQCGWLTDRYGVSWQIVPRMLSEVMLDHEDAKSERIMKALLQMTKLDLGTLRQAASAPI
jgi:predicted 3-demethylubiquinone-9 3-methyltransferase (glyoxalase superfamily)